MTAKRRSSAGWLVALACALSGTVGAQDVPNLEIHLPAGESARALDPIEFTAVIWLPDVLHHQAAASADDPTSPQMLITGFTVRPAGVLTNDYAAAATCQFQEEQGLRIGQRLEIPCIFYPRNGGIKNKLFPSLSAIFAKSFILQTQLAYMQNDNRYERSGTDRIVVLPPLVTVFYGGMMGALLLALFRGLAPFRHGLSREPPQLPLTRRELYTRSITKGVLVVRALMATIAWLVLGGVSAIMIIILTKASSGDLSPVQIEINDFVGGVLVGLLSFPVVDWLERRLVASETSAPASGSEAIVPLDN